MADETRARYAVERLGFGERCGSGGDRHRSVERHRPALALRLGAEGYRVGLIARRRERARGRGRQRSPRPAARPSPRSPTSATVPRCARPSPRSRAGSARPT